MNKMIVTIFNDEKNAYEGLKVLKTLLTSSVRCSSCNSRVKPKPIISGCNIFTRPAMIQAPQ